MADYVCIDRLDVAGGGGTAALCDPPPLWQDFRRLTTATPDAGDSDLLRRIVLRDDAALGELYDRHSRLVYSLALRILRAPADAEEVLQETFVRVWSRASSYEPKLGAPGAWLARIARNVAIDRLRARQVRQNVDAPAPAEPEGEEGSRRPEPATAVTPEALLAEASTADVVRGALLRLPEGQRLLIEAAFFEGYTHSELAARFGLPLGTVKARIRTGLLAMRSHLAPAV